MTFTEPLEISTSEGVEIHMTIAGLGSRFLAWLLDGLILLILLLITGVATSAALKDFYMLAMGMTSVLVVFAPITYLIAMETLNGGRTVGKMAVGLKTIRLNGAPIGFGASLVRSIFVLVDFFLFGIGIICMITTQKSQRFGDLAAKTLVVRERQPSTPAPEVTPLAQTRPPSGTSSDQSDSVSIERWDVSRVTSEEIDVIRAFLSRVHQMDDFGARLALGRKLVERIKPRVSGDSKKMNQEEWLRRVVASKDA